MSELRRGRSGGLGWMGMLSAAVVLLPGFCSASASVTASITVNGSEQAPGGVWDSSTITVTFNGFTETVHYGQYSSQASVASALAAMFSRDYLRDGLCAAATGNVINIKLKNGQAFTPVVIADSNTSFQMAPSGFPGLSGTPDQGTVTLWVTGPNGKVAAASTLYGEGSTPTSIAAGLSQAVSSNSPVTVSAVNDSLYIEAKQSGSASNYAYILQSSSNLFSQSSFGSSSGTLTGGATQGANPTTVYQYVITPTGGPSGYAPNGNLLSYSDATGTSGSVMGAWSFTYDNLNRLTSGSSTAGPYSGNQSCWTYDSFGNRLTEAVSTTPCANSPAPTTWANYNANNQVTGTTQAPGGYTYDGAGNVTYDGLNSYAYDAEGRLCAVAAQPVNGITVYTGYLYNAEGQRVAKGTISPQSWQQSCNLATNGFTPTNEYILGQSGEQLSEVSLDENGVMSWQHTNVYAAGALIASYDPNGLHFLLNDWLGTRRAQTDYAGNLEQTCQSLPFGNGLICTASNTTPTEHHFTGKERDAESGLDYFGARYYGSSMGRFMSPDFGGPIPNMPDPVPWADFENPQSLNLYSYGFNNPMSNTDDDGHDVNVCSTDSNGNQKCSLISNDQYQAAQQANNGGLNVPSLTNVGANGTANITDSSGNTVGTATYVPNSGVDFYSNQGAYAQLSNTSQVVKAGTAIYAGVYGAVGLGIVAADVAIGSELTTLGDIGTTPTSGQVAQAERVLAQSGEKGVQKAIQTLEKRVAEHLQKLDQFQKAGGYTSKTTSEIQNFQSLIRAYQSVLK